MSEHHLNPKHVPLRQLRRLAWLLLATLLLSGCALIHRPINSGLPTSPGEQPDKVLLTKAVNEFNHGRYDTGRLLLQALINTYPDSEYLSRAKLAIADSYYKQGGIAGLTQAEAEYKDFITFFPTAPEAPMAEYRAGMCHFRLMGKSDRDTTEALSAEREFRLFLLRYPDDPMMPTVKDRLREVQEVLAEGDFQTAIFYYRLDANRAAESRLGEIAQKYPNFSQGGEVFWYLGQSWARLEKPRLGIPDYDKLIMEFPLSPYVADAKAQLARMHAPIPKPTLAELARAQADAARDDRRSLFAKAFGGLSGSPSFLKTLHGPVVLGTRNQVQAQITELNKNAAPPSKNAALTATSKTAIPAATATTVDPNAKRTASSASQNKQTAVSGTKKEKQKTKKKSKLHLLKKVMPF